MSTTARCYTCHTLRPIHAFRYRRKDDVISTSAKLKRYLAAFLNRPGAAAAVAASRRGAGGDGRFAVNVARSRGVVLRYRCVNPREGVCPGVMGAGEGEGEGGRNEVEIGRVAAVVLVSSEGRRSLDGGAGGDRSGVDRAGDEDGNVVQDMNIEETPVEVEIEVVTDGVRGDELKITRNVRDGPCAEDSSVGKSEAVLVGVGQTDLV